MPPLTRARAAADAPTLLDALARARAAAALVVAALGVEDRKALRLVCTQLRDAVGEETTKLAADYEDVAAGSRPPTSQRWPRLAALTVFLPELAGLELATVEALGAETWGSLRSLDLCRRTKTVVDVHSVRALTAALRRMPTLRTLHIWNAALSDAAASELFRASSAETVPQLRALSVANAGLTPAAARMLAVTGWRLEALDLRWNQTPLEAAGLAALLAAPSFNLRRLHLGACGLDAASLLTLANAPWPLEELNLCDNDFSAAAGPALAALSRHRGLRKLDVSFSPLSSAGFRALVEATWPALTSFSSRVAGARALGAAAFAGFPVLEELVLTRVQLGEAGLQLLASRRWHRLRRLKLADASVSAAGLAALARGEWPALEHLDLRNNALGAPLALHAARRWAPALEELLQGDVDVSVLVADAD